MADQRCSSWVVFGGGKEWMRESGSGEGIMDVSVVKRGELGDCRRERGGWEK